MQVSTEKVAPIDKKYIWTFLISFLVSIYISFDAFGLGAISTYFEMNITNPIQRYNTIARLLIIVTSLLFFHRKNNLLNLTFLGRVLFIFSIYLLCSSIFIKDFSRPLDILSTFMFSSLWIYIYIFTYTLRLRYDIDRYVPKVIIVFCILSVVLFLKNYNLHQHIGLSDWHYIESYYAIALIPAVTLLKNKYKYLFLAIIIICAIIAGKRTGIIACVISIVLYVLLTGKSLSSKIKTIFVGFVLLGGLYLALNQFMSKEIEAITERIENIKDDEGSGRGDIFNNIYNEIAENQNITSFLFGKGHNEVVNSKSTNGFSAHNEFLEVAYDYGVFGLVLFILVFVAIISSYCRTKTHQYKVVMLLSLFMFFLFSLTSHTILNTTYVVFLCMLWGYVDAKNKIERRTDKIIIHKNNINN